MTLSLKRAESEASATGGGTSLQVKRILLFYSNNGDSCGLSFCLEPVTCLCLRIRSHSTALAFSTPLKAPLNRSVLPLSTVLILAENGEFVVVMDDESRENEGDLILPAQFATTEKFAFLVRHSRYVTLDNVSSCSGLVCLPILGERLDQLEIPLMVPKNTEPHRTAFTISIGFAQGNLATDS